MRFDSMIIYRSYVEAITSLSPEIQTEIWKAVFSYGLDQTEIEIKNPIAAITFKFIKPQIDANQRRAINGKKGGSPKGANSISLKGNQNARKNWETEPKQNQNETKTKPKQNQNETKTKPNINNNINNNNINNNNNNKYKYNFMAKNEFLPIEKKEEKRFIPPSVEEVQSYLDEKNITSIDAEAFVSFYESKGWMIGKNKMKSWKAAITTWLKSRKYETSKSSNQATEKEERDREFAEHIRAQLAGAITIQDDGQFTLPF